MLVSKEKFYAELEKNGMTEFFESKGYTGTTDARVWRLVQYTDVHKDADEYDINTKKVYMHTKEREIEVREGGKWVTKIAPETWHLFGHFYNSTLAADAG